jgi:phosphoribosylformimino-5-aminoimidazole carboxamide ribotide isomerase
MQVIPAIDLQGGRCVRLSQGQFTEVDTYTDDPVRYALRWAREGAARLHMVDLDGARTGSPEPRNVEVIQQVLRAVDIPVQLGGGIRTAETVRRMLDLGLERVILGTSVARNDALARELIDAHGERVVIGIDAKDGFVAVSGWQESLGESAVAFARRIVGMGARRIIFTDIRRDGMLQGVNTAALEEMLAAVPVPVIASGGVGSVEDFRTLAAVKAGGGANLEGVIVGKALYAGRVALPEAITAAAGAAAEG